MKPVLFMRKRSLLGSYFGNHSGVSDLSKSIGNAIGAGILDLLPPANLTVVNVGGSPVSSTELDVSWDAVTNAVGYKLYRDTILISTQATLTFSDTGLTASTAYTYTVTAYNNIGESIQSTGVVGTTGA